MSSIFNYLGRLFVLIAWIIAGAFLTSVKRSPAPETASGLTPNSSEALKPPNILVFVFDDLDTETLQRMLALNHLPNIKSKIVNGAVNFQNAIVPTAMCSASRASLLTGKYAHNHGTWQVIGSEGPEAFDKYLAATGNAYLPTWLGSNYYRAYIGKVHLGRNNPGWNFFRPIEGYDPRPAMYKAREDGSEVMPPVYQTKYIGDSAKQAIRTAGDKPFFAVVAPSVLHVNVSNWRKMDSYSNNSFSGRPVAFTQFRNLSTNTWRQHMITVEDHPGGAVHKWWSRDSATRDSNWSTWSYSGEESTVVPGTGTAPVVGWNILQPAQTTRRQQLIRSNSGTDITFFHRDLVDGQTTPPWLQVGNQSILSGTGSRPLVGWAAITFPSGLIRQQIVRGDDVDGFVSFVRHILPNNGGSTPWKRDPDWGETVVFGRLCGFGLIATRGAGYIIQLVQQRPGATGYEWWQSPELVDFQELDLMGNDLGRDRTPSAARVAAEGPMMAYPFMKGVRRQIESRPSEAEFLMGSRAKTIFPVHPYYLMRAYAEGSWSPVVKGQTYEWGNEMPAGRFRKNGDPHGFDAIEPVYDLPSAKGSFNGQRPVSVPFYGQSTWPNLRQEVWGGRKQQGYLRRLFLDRMEQMLSIDRMVGEVIDAAGPNTIIIFTSDNGHIHGEQRLSNKLTPQDESIRVPLYIKVPGGQQRQISELVGNIDLAPTILDYARLSWASSAYKVDGRSLRPLIEAGGTSSWRRSLLVEFHKPRDRVFPATDWRFGLPDYLGLREFTNSPNGIVSTLYVQYYADAADRNSTLDFEYYNMTTDPYQTINLTQTRIARLDDTIREFYSASGDLAREKDQSSTEIV